MTIVLSTASLCPQNSSADQRAVERYPPGEMEMAQFVVQSSYRPNSAIIRDISLTGVSFLFREPYRTGTVLALQLEAPGRSFHRALKATVAHARQYSPHEDQARWQEPPSLFWRILGWFGFQRSIAMPENQLWLIGCQFTQPLNDEELQLILA